MSEIQAQLEWRNAQPYSSQYDDVYFSTDDGWAETEYVFLQHNQLEDRKSTRLNSSHSQQSRMPSSA